MELLVMDESFVVLYLIDFFESLIWTERFNSAGNFELYIPLNDTVFEIFKVIQSKIRENLNVYCSLKDSESVMIIEDIEISTDVEIGNHVIITGRSLESILERKIIWKQTVLDSKLETGIKKLIDENIINPIMPERRIDNFIFEMSTDPVINNMKIRAQYTGDNLYDTIQIICESYGIGFKITLNEDNQFVFRLYSGTDRSYDQVVNPYVVFSPKFDNLISSNLLESSKTLKNVALVAGEDEGNERRTIIIGSARGLSRRELYVDARDIQSETSDGSITDEEYNEQLVQRGLEKLSENIYTRVCEGQVEAVRTFVYGKDFFKGDLVQISTEYGMDAKVLVSEVVRTQDLTGYNIYPTFKIIE